MPVSVKQTVTAWKNTIVVNQKTASSMTTMQNIYAKGTDNVWRPVWTYTWKVGDWGPCSVSCGGGTQSRTVQCMRNDGLIVDDSFCLKA